MGFPRLQSARKKREPGKKPNGKKEKKQRADLCPPIVSQFLPLSPPAARAQALPAVLPMAIPTRELEHIYEAEHSIIDTFEHLRSALTTQKALLATTTKQKHQLEELRDKLAADIAKGNRLPHATKRERARRCWHIDCLLEWLGNAEQAIGEAVFSLSDPPTRANQAAPSCEPDFASSKDLEKDSIEKA